ncbi:VanW family protein [Halonatronum saccharophilum]|uniref:VanW family protein n=1 Tax=Halonatronum saccharophilum TaxID=150060 RepID=UPI0004B6364E|nr:VanW family protein [Halonatronum saccharophilum]
MTYKVSFPNSPLDESHNVDILTNEITGLVIEAGETFSINKVAGPYSSDRGYRRGESYHGSKVIKTYGGGVCKVASALYNLAILSNLEVVERHSHGMPIPYVPPGRDSALAYDYKDLKFKNTTDGPILIWGEVIGDDLYLALYGTQPPPSVTWKQKIIETEGFPTIKKKTKRLKEGEEKVVIQGTKGITIKSWLLIEYSNGRKERKNLGVDSYNPRPRVVLVGEGE